MISLLELFRPPRGMKGTHLMVCGLSAEPSVLNAALEIFTEEVSLAHRLTGRLVGLLMLDASQPLFAPEDVPGVMQIPPPRALTWADRSSLLHAKVALLGFSRIPHGSPERFRLIVSTGNWTTRSFGVGGDIDMVWRCDASPNVKNESYRDCVAAFLFFQRLLEELYEFPIRECPDAARDFLNVWRNLYIASIGHCGDKFPLALRRSNMELLFVDPGFLSNLKPTVIIPSYLKRLTATLRVARHEEWLW